MSQAPAAGWKLVWWEDECTRSDPSAEKWEAAYERITGLSAPALGEGVDYYDSTTWFLSETMALILWPDGYSLRSKPSAPTR